MHDLYTRNIDSSRNSFFWSLSTWTQLFIYLYIYIYIYRSNFCSPCAIISLAHSRGCYSFRSSENIKLSRFISRNCSKIYWRWILQCENRLNMVIKTGWKINQYHFITSVVAVILPWSVGLSHLSHWGRMTHICVSKLTIIGSDNGLSPGRWQAIIWTNAGILFIGHLGKKFSETRMKMSSAKWRPFCLGLNVLKMMKFYWRIYASLCLNQLTNLPFMLYICVGELGQHWLS